MVDELYELCEYVTKEIEEANDKIRSADGKLSAGDVDYIDKLTHTLKSIKTTIAMLENEDGEYSHRGDGYARNYRGNSYARNRRRDSRGRYSRGGGMVEELRELMADAPDEKTRAEMQRLVNKLETM